MLLALAVVVVPGSLIAASRARFGGAAPLHGVPSPTDWQFDRIQQALTDRLTEHTIADIVIRLSLIVAWIAVVVVALTVVTETVHMVRHRGLSMPDIRGLGVPQSLARVIAAGLLVVVPAVSSPGRAIARDGVQLLPLQSASSTIEADAGLLRAAGPAVSIAIESSAPVDAEADRYVVRAGDSIYGIAELMAGPAPASVADYAERLLDLNLDTTMPDGQRFTNAAYIEVGWVLELPSGDGARHPEFHHLEPSNRQRTPCIPASRCGRSPTTSWAMGCGGRRSSRAIRAERSTTAAGSPNPT